MTVKNNWIYSAVYVTLSGACPVLVVSEGTTVCAQIPGVFLYVDLNGAIRAQSSPGAEEIAAQAACLPLFQELLLQSKTQNLTTGWLFPEALHRWDARCCFIFFVDLEMVIFTRKRA
jgi:hypothetical protein